MKILNRILTLAGVTFINVAVSYACTCIGPGNATEAVELSEAVFSGRVISSNKFQATVELERTWKGKFTRARVVVFNPDPNGSCSMTLRRGERYIVFAGEDKEKGKVSYIPRICFPTSVLSKAGQTLKEIGEGVQFKKRVRSARS